ncbi:MAG: hypothetical protein JWO82_721 [Akkermansiaceae bacterium]|nr:hypothetical protein [Akkermansiaceae bacterium]
MSEFYETPSEPIPESAVVPQRMEKVVRLIFAAVGATPIIVAIPGYFFISRFGQMFRDLGGEASTPVRLVFYGGGIIPMGLLALTGLAVIISALAGKMRWIVVTFGIAILATLVVFPITIWQINHYLVEISSTH